MKLPEPPAERGQLSLQRIAATCNRGARAAAHASPLRASFFLLSFFSHPPPALPPSPAGPLSRPGGGGCCATSRAAVPRERGSSQHPAGPLAAVTGTPLQPKHRRAIQPRPREPIAGPGASSYCPPCIGRGPSRCLNFQGTKFGINSKHLCASPSPATAKLVSPPYQAARWPTSPVDERAPWGLICAGARAHAHAPTRAAAHLLPRYELSGRGAFHTREASQFAGESSEHSVPFPGPLPECLAEEPWIGRLPVSTPARHSTGFLYHRSMGWTTSSHRCFFFFVVSLALNLACLWSLADCCPPTPRCVVCRGLGLAQHWIHLHLAARMPSWPC